MTKIIKNRFFIVNETDKPCRDLVAEKREDGLLYYIFNQMVNHKEPMSADRATPIEHFGFIVMFNEIENYYQFSKNGVSWAEYEDGTHREWQDVNHIFQYHPKYKTNEQYMVFIEGKQSPKKIHNTKAAAKAEAERILKTDSSAAKAYVVKVQNIIEREISLKVTYEAK